jgi:hypothetical protein
MTLSKTLEKVVGAVRFELTTSCTRNKRASQATLRPDTGSQLARNPAKWQMLFLSSSQAPGWRRAVNPAGDRRSGAPSAGTGPSWCGAAGIPSQHGGPATRVARNGERMGEAGVQGRFHGLAGVDGRRTTTPVAHKIISPPGTGRLAAGSHDLKAPGCQKIAPACRD